MTRLLKLNVFLWLCVIGVVGNLIIWMLPVSFKPYHHKRFMDEWTPDFIVEQVSELGFDSDGVVKIRYSHQFSGGSRAAIAQLRTDWHEKIEHGNQRWPTDSKRLHYDEWGPSNWNRPDGVHEIEVGSVYCVPYAFMAMGFALPPIIWVIWKLMKRRRTSHWFKLETSTSRSDDDRNLNH